MVGVKGSSVTRGLVLAVSCLVLGFVGGWTLGNLGGDTVALPSAKVDVTVETPNPKTTDQTPPSTSTGADVDRGTVAVHVFNASGVEGAAAKAAASLKGLGWTTVTTGNVPRATGTAVYYVDGAKEAATLLGGDFQVTQIAPLAGSAVASAAPAAAKVVVVIGT